MSKKGKKDAAAEPLTIVNLSKQLTYRRDGEKGGFMVVITELGTIEANKDLLSKIALYAAFANDAFNQMHARYNATESFKIGLAISEALEMAD